MKYESFPSSMAIWNIFNSPCVKTINKKAKSLQNVFHKELNVETLLIVYSKENRKTSEQSFVHTLVLCLYRVWYGIIL